MKLIWQPIPDYPYEVSNDGRVRRAVGGQGTRAGYILKPKMHSYGYPMFDLSRNNIVYRFTLSHLVALAFCGPRPSNEHKALHNDGNPKHNHPSNIRWGTQQENMDDARRHGRIRIGSRHQNAKLTEADVRKIRRLRKTTKLTFKQLAKMFGVNAGNIHAAAVGLQWRHVK